MTFIDEAAEKVQPRVVATRRDLHQYPELGNREFRTAGVVTERLQSLGIETRTGIAHTGVLGILRGGLPGGVVALRADMDALPVAEETGLPFASKERATYNGHEVGVMHACGHDAHVAILLGVAEVLSGIRKEIPGTVVFVFQPAEEGAPEGEEGGAELMVREGALEDPKVQAIFGLHVGSRFPLNHIGFRSGSQQAAVDTFTIRVIGKQTHGAYPWLGVDPVVVAAQIVLGLQTIPSRQLNSTIAPSIVTIGSIHGGVRNNIIPEEVELRGTIRSLDARMREELDMRIRRTAEAIATSAGATAEVQIARGYPMTYNEPNLVERMLPTLHRVGGAGNVTSNAHASLGAEDFSYFQQQVPGFFFWLGTRPTQYAPEEAPSNHSSRFMLEESGMLLGVRALAHLAVDFLASEQGKSE